MHLEVAKKYFLTCIFLVLTLAFVIRIYNLNTNPPGFFADEAAIGFNAYKLATTGADEYNVPFPVFFRSFGDYRLPIPIYANIPFVVLFGLQEISVRLTAVAFGLISIFFIMLIGKQMQNESVGILAGFLTAISPWHIQLSRWGSEYIYFPAIFSIAFYVYLKSFKQTALFSLSLFFFALSLYTYYPTLIVTPIFTIFAVVLFLFKVHQKNKWSQAAIGIVIFVATCLPLLVAYHNGTLLTRWESVNNTKLSITKRITEAAQTYAGNFSLDFLFTKGDSGLPKHYVTRHSVKGFGELFIFELPFLLVGIFFALFRSKHSPQLLLLFLLLALYPIGSAVTHDGPLATRSVIGIIPLMLFCAIGIDFFLEKKFFTKHKFRFLFWGINIVFFIFIGGSLFTYFVALYNEYPMYSANFWGWQYGARSIITYFVSKENNYDEEIMAPEFNSPEIFFKFYAPKNCSKCMVGLPDKLYNPAKKQLYALAPSYFKKYPSTRMNIKQVIFYPDNSVAFLIGEIVQ